MGEYFNEIKNELRSKRIELGLEMKDIKSFISKNNYTTEKEKIIFNYIFDKEFVFLENQYESRDMFETDEDYYNQYYDDKRFDKKDLIKKIFYQEKILYQIMNILSNFHIINIRYLKMKYWFLIMMF